MSEASEEDLPFLTLRDGLPRVIEDPAALASYADALAAGSGPVAIDAERASGYRYSQRAYLIQLRREGAGTALIDPIPLADLDPLIEALAGTEWILHAATQDLSCLAEVGLVPDRLFDTELAGRLLGKPRVGLASLVETELGQRLRKEHSAADWSTRPLPESWLDYAALDVEVLIELRAALQDELDQSPKAAWAREEFDALLTFTPAVREDRWRRTSGANVLRDRRAQAALRALWTARDTLAQERDIAPGRLLPDGALVAAAKVLPRHRRALLGVQGFHGRGAARYANTWLEAIETARALPESELPTRPPRGDGPPQPRVWAERDPVAARRLAHARTAMAALSEEWDVPLENLLTPDYLRRAMWAPPSTRKAEALQTAMTQQLLGYGARPWQVELTAPPLTEAVLAGDQPPTDPTGDQLEGEGEDD